VLGLLRSAGLPYWRRSELTAPVPIAAGVVLLDTIGELGAIYGIADIAFVGGSLVPAGGHNIVEPARAGVPVIVGEHTANFRDITSLFREAHAVRVVRA